MTSLEDQLKRRTTVPTSHYDFEQLADIYNQTRVDYIVPMPMNAKRMMEYVYNYDVDLDVSVVALNGDRQEVGIGMVGLREDRVWLTRLGVLPLSRGLKMGQYLMESMLERAAEGGAKHAQLEVIVGNDPAHGLFVKLGFEDVRKLLIIRRPPGKIEQNDAYETADIRMMADGEVPFYLEQRDPYASWVEETPSLLNAGRLQGMIVTMPDGQTGWVIFQKLPFQLTHIVLSPASQYMMEVMLYHIHRAHPMHDTKVENMLPESVAWQAYQNIGYFEVFARTEMYLTLG